MPKQEFDLLDMMAPLVVACIFGVIVFLISFTIINWYCITKKDDLTVFEKLGARTNLRLGPHTMLQIKRGGFASTYAREEEEEHRKLTLSMDGPAAQTARLITKKAEQQQQQKASIAEIPKNVGEL